MEVPCVWFKVMKVNRYGLIEFCEEPLGRPTTGRGVGFLNRLQFSHCDRTSMIILPI